MLIVIWFLSEKSVLLSRILKYCNNMSYRPHNPGHDYYDKGIYLITLVVGERDRLLGDLNMDARNPGVRLTALVTFGTLYRCNCQNDRASTLS